MVRNELRRLISQRGITRYRFWQDTKLNRATAYRLYDDPFYIPGGDVMDTIAKVYGWQPGAYVIYIPDEVTTDVA